jgi:integrase
VTQRRTKGDGGLIQRHDHPTCPPLIDGTRAKHACRGRWVGTLVVEVDGRKGRKSVYGRTKREAKLKLDQAIRDRDTGMLVARTVTVESWLEDWLERRRKPPKPLKPQTWRGYKSKIHTYIVPAIGRHKLTALKPEHIEAMYEGMRGAGLSEATIRQTHAILKKALKDAIRRDKLARTPMDRVDPPGTEKNKRDQLTPTQAALVLRAAGDDARWWLAVYYGMRQGEVLGIDWADVDTVKWLSLTVRETLQTDYDGGLILGAPKSRASKRTLPLVPLMAARLKLHWEHEGRPTAGLVFHRDGNPIPPRADWEAWRALLAKAKAPTVALHAARNTAASVMEASGVPDRLVMQILGQTQVQTTHGYQTADLERMVRALEGVADLLELS